MGRKKMLGRRVRVSFSLSVAAAVAGLGLGNRSAQAVMYQITNLGALSGQADTYATSINNNAEIAISTLDAGTGKHPVIDTGSSYVNVTSLANSSDTLTQVNNSGLVVGYSTDSSSNEQAVYTTATSPTLTVLPTLAAGGQSLAYGVSPTGQFGTATVVGTSLNAGGQFQAVTWVGSTVTALSPSNTTAWDTTQGSAAYAINLSGTITGQATAAGTEDADAFVTGPGGTFKDIAPTGSVSSVGNSINSNGLITGTWNDASGDQYGFVYSPTTGLSTPLEDLAAQPPGSLYFTDAESINSAGQIVGGSYNSSGSEVAVMYDSSGNVTDLNTLLQTPSSAWDLINAESINDSGDIVGYGTFNGAQDAFLLTPAAVPEPSGTIVAIGIGALLLHRRRRAVN
jgi:hypothetical protein